LLELQEKCTHPEGLSECEGDAEKRSQSRVGERQWVEELESFLSAHIAHDPEVKDLGLLHDALYPKPAKLLTAKVAIGQSEFMEALIDGGSQLNLLSVMLAKEHDLPVQPLPKLLAEGVDGNALKIYGTTIVAIKIVDSRGKEEIQDVPVRG
jgi:hypothetical protein